MTAVALILSLTLNQAAADTATLKRTVEVETAAAERAPDDTEALYRLGLALLALGDARKAVPHLEKLVEQDPESVDAKLLLSKAYQSSGAVEKATGLLDRSILSLPEDASLRAARAQLARQLEDLNTAVDQYRKAVEYSAQDPELIFNLGEALQAQHNRKALDEAVDLYRRVLSLKSDFTPAKVNLGKALAEKGLFGEAKELLQAVCRESMNDAEAHYNLGVILLRENAFTNAITEFERALAIAPRHSFALNNLGVALDARGETKKALEYFKKAAIADPSYAEAFFNQGMSYLDLKQPTQATKAFEKALKLEPAETGPYVKLGSVYLEQGKRDRAVEAFKKAIDLQEKREADAGPFDMLKRRLAAASNTDAYQGLASAYLGLGKVTEAVEALKRAVDKLPKDPTARQGLGEAYLAQGNFDGAVEQFKARLELTPTTEARLDLARAFTRKGVAREAEPLFRAILAEEKDNRAAQVGLADLFLSMRRYAEAETVLKALVESDPSDALALSRIGILKSRMGRPDQALDPLEKAVQLNPSLFDARAEYAYLLLRASPDNADRCVRMTRDVLIAEPRHALSHYYLGVCQYALGNKPGAEKSFKDAITIEPNAGPVHFSLGEFYENEGKKDAALKEYEVAAKLEFPEATEALKRLKGQK